MKNYTEKEIEMMRFFIAESLIMLGSVQGRSNPANLDAMEAKARCFMTGREACEIIYQHERRPHEHHPMDSQPFLPRAAAEVQGRQVREPVKPTREDELMNGLHCMHTPRREARSRKWTNRALFAALCLFAVAAIILMGPL